MLEYEIEEWTVNGENKRSVWETWPIRDRTAWPVIGWLLIVTTQGHVVTYDCAEIYGLCCV